MNFVRIASLAILLLVVSAARSEKKIELQDIEEDNLKSELENLPDTPEPNVPESEKNLVSLELLKRGQFGPNFQNQTPSPPPQHTPYVHQYAVNEPSDKLSAKYPNVLTATTSQQATIGYLSNLPMHIYLIPQSYGEQTQETVNHPTAASAQESYYDPALSSLANYVEIPAYLVPTGKSYMHQYTPQVSYVTYDPRSAAVPANQHLSVLTGPAASTGLSNPSAPLISYNAPTPPFPYKMIQKEYYAGQRGEPNETEDPSENELKELDNCHEQIVATEFDPFLSQYPQYDKQQAQALLRNNQPSVTVDKLRGNYPSGTVETLRGNYPSGALETPRGTHHSGAMETLRGNHPSGTLETFRDNYPSGSLETLSDKPPSGAINELPTPNPLLLKGSTSSIPKALPYYRPTLKPIYGTMRYSPNHNSPKPSGAYAFFKKYPNSLLDSYIPSKVQIEYMKKSFNKDPLSAYEALSSSRQLYSHSPAPRTYERGFLPNQMYHTAAGGVTFGHFKNSVKTGTFAHY